MNRDCAQLCAHPAPHRASRAAVSSAARPRSAGLPLSAGLRTGAVVALLLICIAPRQAVCQFARQPELLSRPASVVLVARLETLSLAAIPTVNVSSLSSGAMPVPGSLSITTSWALPRNLTTLRLTVYRNTSFPDRVVPSLGDKESKESPDTIALTPEPAAPLSGQTVLIQGSGDSNQATSRTDHLQIAPSTNIVGQKVTGEGGVNRAPQLTFVVQAL